MQDLTKELMNAIFRFKKISVNLPAELNLHIGELFIMCKIDECLQEPDAEISMADIQSQLHVTKPAVSQTINSLEKKGFIKREINSSDRRRFIITLTPKGRRVTQAVKKHTDKMISEIIARFGEDNTKQLISLFNRFADISETTKIEISPAELEGEINE